MPWYHGYTELETCLRTYSVEAGMQYDFVGVTHLMLACLDNLRQFALEADLERFPECIDNEQRAFLRKLLEMPAGEATEH
jgi:hypothetical protein